MHRGEVERHLAALRAGSPSPLSGIGSVRSAAVVVDYSETVIYSGAISEHRSEYSAQSLPASGARNREMDSTQAVSDATGPTTQPTLHLGSQRLELKGGSCSSVPGIRGGGC